MKLGIPSSGTDLNDEIDSRFGRCEYFIVVETETMDIEGMENPFKSASQAAGIRAVEFLAKKGVEMVITTNLGPNAEGTLRQAGIGIVTGVTGRIEEIVKDFKNGNLKIQDTVQTGRISAKSPPGTRPRMGLGPEGECFCPACGITIPHQQGIPCMMEVCPSCGDRMRRK